MLFANTVKSDAFANTEDNVSDAFANKKIDAIANTESLFTQQCSRRCRVSVANNME